jgi:hypothetical protein
MKDVGRFIVLFLVISVIAETFSSKIPETTPSTNGTTSVEDESSTEDQACTFLCASKVCKPGYSWSKKKIKCVKNA